MRKLSLLLVLVLALFTGTGLGCDDNSPTDPIIEEPEPVPTVTDIFTGTLALGQTSCHVFAAVNAGPAEIMITDLQPLATLTVGLGIGLDDGDEATPCNYFAIDRSVRIAETLQSTLVDIADYCVCIFDVGNIFPDQTVTYTFQVVHP